MSDIDPTGKVSVITGGIGGIGGAIAPGAVGAMVFSPVSRPNTETRAAWPGAS